MNRYEWLVREIAAIPRRKFFVFERRNSSALDTIEAQYGSLPLDYRYFVQSLGQAKLFRSVHSLGYNLLVWAPPIVIASNPARSSSSDVTRIRIGHQINTGYAWLEWADGSFLDEGAVFVGLSGQRRKAAISFEEWLKRSFSASRKLYSKKEWNRITQPAPGFTESEQAVVDAIPKFNFRKTGVTADGNVLIEVQNRSSLIMPYLTIGVRNNTEMSGSTTLAISSIAPGETAIIEQAVYRGVMDPHELELFSLPLPDPEDRQYYRELENR